MAFQLFNMNGVLAKNLQDIHDIYYILKKNDEVYESNINLYKKEVFRHSSVYLDLFLNRLFGGKLDIYHYLEHKYFLNIQKSKYYTNAGLGGESLMPMKGFSDFIDNQINDDPIASREDIIKYMYCIEIQALVADFEKLIIQSEESIYIFYEKFNNPTIFKSHDTKEGLTTIYSMESRFINTILETIIIKSTSILDYLSKFVFEVENTPKAFNEYPKRASLDYNHGKTKLDQKKESLKISWTEKDRLNTIFDENLGEIFILKQLRNQIIHDGFLDVDNTIYENKINGVLEERFILMPDFEGHNLTKYKGRKLFYSQDKKINLELPKLIETLMAATLQTLNVMLKKYWFDEFSEHFTLTLEP